MFRISHSIPSSSDKSCSLEAKKLKLSYTVLLYDIALRRLNKTGFIQTSRSCYNNVPNYLNFILNGMTVYAIAILRTAQRFSFSF